MHSIDRQLLLGILALQNNFIDRNQLVGAFTVWVSNKARSLCEVLIENGAITDELGAVLVQLVNLHLQANRDDVHTCLLKHSSVKDVCHQLSQIKDNELKQSIGDLQPARDEEMDDPYRTEATGAIESHGIRYEIRRPLGRGGLGIVSIAHDRELNREVALKEIRPDQSHIESLRRKFLVEAEVTGNLEHPGIVPVYGLGVQPDGRPYYAMRFIQGDNLGVHIRLFHQKIKKGLESFDGSELRSLLRRFLDICDAIGYAHSRGVLHRDLKPGNIMLGRFGETLVVDWGLAKTEGVSGASIQEGIDTPFLPKFKSDDHTQFGSTIGTPAYAPPEQIEGQLEQVNERSDVYGLGAILYELLCNATPATGATFEEVRSNIVAGRITPPVQKEVAVPRALSDICMKALATAPSNRYDSPKSLMKDVECWLDDLPMTAHRENVATHFNRWLRKNRRVALTGLTSLVAIALLSGTYAWIAYGLRRTAVNAKQAADMAKEAAESAKQAAIEQRDHADRNFQLAREAVDQYLTDVSQDPQLAIAGFQPLRKKLLDDASDYYQQFLAQRGDDAGVLRESAAAHHRLASIYSVLGQFDRGLEAADRASQQYSLLASKDHSPLLQLEIAECELERAQLLTNVGKLTEAKVLADKINEQLKSSNRELNGSLRLPAALAASYDLVASIAIRLNDRPTMTTAIEESQKLRQAIVSESPTLNALLALIATRMNASSSAAEQRNFEAAISSYQHSLSELEAHSDMDRSTAIRLSI